MERIAFISGEAFIYWSPIILAMAAVAAIAIYTAVYIKRDGNIPALALSIVLCVVLAIPLSRFLHWYHRADTYTSLGAAMTNMTGGGFALYGVFAAGILAALVLRLTRVSKSMPRMLDAMALGGGVGIAVGRLASLFNASDRGMILPEGVGLPFAWPVTNAVSGATENRLATFAIQSMVVTVIVAAIFVYLLLCALRKKQVPDGDIFLLFILPYGATQAVCDSTRYDSLFMRSNGFVSVVQILGLALVILAVVLFSLRAVKNTGLKARYFVIWGGMLALAGTAGVMEYLVQRRAHLAAMTYSIMSASMLLIVALALVVRYWGTPKKAAVFETL